MRRLIQLVTGRASRFSTTSTNSESGTASGERIPPRRRVSRAIRYAPGTAKSAYHAIPFGMWLLEWCAISWASTSSTWRGGKPSTRVSQSTIWRDGPKPAAYAFTSVVSSETCSTFTGTPSMPCLRWKRSDAAISRGSSRGSVSPAGSHGKTNAKVAPSAMKTAEPGIHQRSPKRPGEPITTTSAKLTKRNSAPSTPQFDTAHSR